MDNKNNNISVGTKKLRESSAYTRNNFDKLLDAGDKPYVKVNSDCPFIPTPLPMRGSDGKMIYTPKDDKYIAEYLAEAKAAAEEKERNKDKPSQKYRYNFDEHRLEKCELD
jgi:hypothetical protein